MPNEIRRAFYLVVASVAAMYVIAGAFGVYVYVAAEENRQTLCTFRDDIQRRHDAGVEFLKENPNGTADFDADTIRNSIMNQQSTLDSLDGLDC